MVLYFLMEPLFDLTLTLTCAHHDLLRYLGIWYAYHPFRSTLTGYRFAAVPGLVSVAGKVKMVMFDLTLTRHFAFVSFFRLP